MLSCDLTLRHGPNQRSLPEGGREVGRIELLQDELAAARETISAARANAQVWFTSVSEVG